MISFNKEEKEYFDFVLNKLIEDCFGKYSCLSFVWSIRVKKDNSVDFSLNVKAENEEAVKEIFYRLCRKKEDKIAINIKNISSISTTFSSKEKSTRILEKENLFIDTNKKQIVCEKITNYFTKFWLIAIKDVNNAIFRIKSGKINL